MVFPQVLQQLTQLFLTRPCSICDRPSAAILCPTCHQQLLDCQLPPFSPKVQSSCLQTETSVPLFAWGEYRGVLKRSLAQLKYHGQAELGFWLGSQLRKTWKYHQHHYEQPVIIPIPLHQQRLQHRGYNQAALIAKGFCRVTGLPLIEQGLVRIKATQAMHSLGIHERQTNLKRAFQLGRKRPTQPVLLIDDIYTTGTTAQAAAAVLVQSGYPVVGIMTVAQAALSAPSVESAKHSQPHQKLNLRLNQ